MGLVLLAAAPLHVVYQFYHVLPPSEPETHGIVRHILNRQVPAKAGKAALHSFGAHGVDVVVAALWQALVVVYGQYALNSVGVHLLVLEKQYIAFGRYVVLRAVKVGKERYALVGKTDSLGIACVAVVVGHRGIGAAKVDAQLHLIQLMVVVQHVLGQLVVGHQVVAVMNEHKATLLPVHAGQTHSLEGVRTLIYFILILPRGRAAVAHHQQLAIALCLALFGQILNVAVAVGYNGKVVAGLVAHKWHCHVGTVVLAHIVGQF